jgi:hypothetical protein
MSRPNEAAKNPLNQLLENFQARMVAKGIKDAMEEAELRAERLKAEREERARELAMEAEEEAADPPLSDFTIGNQDGRVLVVFPQSVDWIGFTPEEAVIVAQALTENAAAAMRWTPPTQGATDATG